LNFTSQEKSTVKKQESRLHIKQYTDLPKLEVQARILGEYGYVGGGSRERGFASLVRFEWRKRGSYAIAMYRIFTVSFL